MKTTAEFSQDKLKVVGQIWWSALWGFELSLAYYKVVMVIITPEFGHCCNRSCRWSLSGVLIDNFLFSTVTSHDDHSQHQIGQPYM